MPFPRRAPWLPRALVSLSLMATVAHAQSEAPEESPEADGFVAEGIELRARGKDNEALRAFQRAAAIAPDSVRVQVHLATVHQALGHWLLADEYLSGALARQNHPYVNRHRQVLEDAKRVIDANIGRLEVEGEPAGAEVRLNGRLLGTLPLSGPVRSTVGSFRLEVRREGHYPVQRPIVITGGGLVRESVHLEPLPANESWRAVGVAAPGRAVASPLGGVDDAGEASWLAWAFAGAAGLAGATTVGAIIIREQHADRWNDDSRCLEVARSREQICGDERDKVNTAEAVALVSGTLTGVFALGAVLTAAGVFDVEAPAHEVGLRGCGVSFSGAACVGTF